MIRTKKEYLVAVCAVSLLLPPLASAEPFLVENGEARAEIIISDTPTRAQRLAARELQTYLKKLSGAEARIGSEPSDDFPVKLYVGASSFTGELGISADELRYGAYRIVSGEDWMVFIGDDTDFVPIEPWPRSNTEVTNGKMQKAWDTITGENWGYPHRQLYKHYSGPNKLFGTPEEQKTDRDGNINIWTFDERGSFNAVCGYLRKLGVRWYMPGELGEILPTRLDSIALPEIDETVHPDFAMRNFQIRPGGDASGQEAMMWGNRLGMRRPYGRQAAHGLRDMTDNEHTMKHHPDWFALYGGQRHNQPYIKNNQLCYSNEELFAEAVRFAQVQFDHFDMDVVSIMPPDGYTAICQCELCEGKESPELGPRGHLSNYVWDFVNRVAKEIAISHPGKKISNCAYGVYTEPPSNIDKLEPNVQVIVVGGRRPKDPDPENIRRIREAWTKKTDSPIEIFENYPFTARNFYLPVFNPTLLGEGINATKGISRGEDVWLSLDFGEMGGGLNHFMVYFTARMYWGGKDQDINELLNEYLELFYGPAAEPMGQFFAYCEEHWMAMDKDAEKAGRALELFELAKGKADQESIYARRLAMVGNFLERLRLRLSVLSQKRGPVPSVRKVGGDPVTPIVVDGKLDDLPWQKIATSSTGKFRENQTGEAPEFPTTFMVQWRKGILYFAIRCEEKPGEPLRIATQKNEDPALWYGDTIEILLETDRNSYYQIAVNPAGAIIDMDRSANKAGRQRWSSQAEVATHVADDHWIVEIGIPVTRDENDPYHQVIGNQPSIDLPWHINLCRQRVRDDGTEHSAFAPTGTKGFHVPMKFGHFHKGSSHRFQADPSVTDYLIDSAKAKKLVQAKKREEALSIYRALADDENSTPRQESLALEQASRIARGLKDSDLEKELRERLEAIR
ncbi:MAG: hypothetical protein CMO61_09345 [Verrucomicrobiales bacterium]|nr:hypothetical protein [Verrucomicrobiales bacterium]|tara:strand:+ start:3684 stop:6404 length:2721 start_codon:yes stop_codon:yes gene_type:complete